MLTAGCSFLGAATDRTVTMHQGYELTCENVLMEACARMADDFVHASLAPDAPSIVSMRVDAHGVRTVCRDEITGVACIDYPQ